MVRTGKMCTVKLTKVIAIIDIEIPNPLNFKPE